MAAPPGASPQGASPQSASPLVVVAAGGTGGHLFPAEALSIALAKRGITVDLATDERATRYGGAFPARATHVVPSDTFRGRNPVAVTRTTLVLAKGVLAGLGLLRDLRPRNVSLGTTWVARAGNAPP